MARIAARRADPLVRDLIGEYLALDAVHHQLVDRVGRAMESGELPPMAASLTRLLHAEYSEKRADIAMRIAGSGAVAGTGTDPGTNGVAGIGYLMRQGGSLGGGSTEMARNLISERLLGMPREAAPDYGIPFNQVKRGR